MRLIRRLFIAIFVVFILPALGTLAWWTLQDRPGSWRVADWSSAGILPDPTASREAEVHLLAARTGGLKGALAVHSWLVIKRPGESVYERYDKVGWGMPVRRNAYAADGRWYSNVPAIIHSVTGEQAAALMPRIDSAIASYPWSRNGDYHIWPGPNSNSFVAHVLREVPEIGTAMPPNATGRDYRPGLASLDWSREAMDLHVTIGGFLGFAAGLHSGLELHFLGLVAGVDVTRPALKIPGYGRVALFSED